MSIVDIVDISHLWFLGFWGRNKAQKTSENSIYSRFCAFLHHFIAFLNGGKLWKLNSTKVVYPLCGYTVTGDRLKKLEVKFFSFVFLVLGIEWFLTGGGVK